MSAKVRFLRSITGRIGAILLITTLLLAAAPPQAVFAANVYILSVSVGGPSGSATYGTAADVSYGVEVTCAGQGGGSTFTPSVSSVLPSGVTADFSPGTLTWGQNCGSAANPQTTTLTLHTTSSTPAGVTGFSVVVGGVTNSTASLTVHAIQLSVTGFVADNKQYDGTTVAVVDTDGAALSGPYTGDVTLVKAGVTGSFADRFVGINKTVTASGFSLGGSNSGNYTLIQPTATADITKADLTAFVSTASNKVYDGTTTTTVTLSTDKVSGDSVTATCGAANFADKNVGNGKIVTCTGITIGGAHAGNYNLVNTSAAGSADITKKNITSVIADDQTIRADQTVPDPLTVHYAVGDLVGGDEPSDIDTPPTCSVIDQPDPLAVGTYVIDCLNGTDNNYSFGLPPSYVDGTLTITEANNVPTDIALSKTTVKDNLPSGTTVGALSTTDPDAGVGESYSYTLPTGVLGCDGTDNASFQFGVVGDAWSLQTAATFHYLTKNSYNICIQTSDGRGGTYAEPFTITVLPGIVTFKSLAAYDGWIMESSETSTLGGTMNSAQFTLRLGDNASDKQYRSILYFDTSALPDNAVILTVRLRLTQESMVGVPDIFTVLDGLKVDIKQPLFGTQPLELTDFQEAPGAGGQNQAATVRPTLSNGRYLAKLKAVAHPFVNKNGTTQLRLRFQLGDNDNGAADYLTIYSGDAGIGRRPSLIVTFAVPAP